MLFGDAVDYYYVYNKIDIGGLLFAICTNPIRLVEMLPPHMHPAIYRSATVATFLDKV